MKLCKCSRCSHGPTPWGHMQRLCHLRQASSLRSPGPHNYHMDVMRHLFQTISEAPSPIPSLPCHSYVQISWTFHKGSSFAPLPTHNSLRYPLNGLLFDSKSDLPASSGFRRRVWGADGKVRMPAQAKQAPSFHGHLSQRQLAQTAATQKYQLSQICLLETQRPSSQALSRHRRPSHCLRYRYLAQVKATFITLARCRGLYG